MKSKDFWIVTRCGSYRVGSYEGTYRLHFEGQLSLAPASARFLLGLFFKLEDIGDFLRNLA
jgi:hypothetical protein